MIAPRIIYSPKLTAPAYGLHFRTDHVLFRPYSPRGTTKSGLWLERNPLHPRIWGWLLAVPDHPTVNEALKVGAMLVVKRNQGEVVLKEEPQKPRYIGHKLDVVCLPIDAIQLVIDPPLVPLEV